MTLALVISLTLVLSIGGFFLKRDFKKSDNQNNKTFGTIFFYAGLLVLIVGVAHEFLHKTSWTDDRKQLFLYISMGSILIYTILICALFGLKAKKESNKIGLIVWSALLIIGIIGSFASFSRISAMNEGWSKEKESLFLNNCERVCPTCDSNSGKVLESLDCSCQLTYTKIKYPKFEDYNKEKDTKAYKKYINDNCNACSEKVQEKNTNNVEGLPDDF